MVTEPPLFPLAGLWTLQMGALLTYFGCLPTQEGGLSLDVQLSQPYGNTPSRLVLSSFVPFLMFFTTRLPPSVVQSSVLRSNSMKAFAPATQELSIVSCPYCWNPLLMMNSARFTPSGHSGVGQFIGGVLNETFPLNPSPAGADRVTFAP